MTRFRPVAAAAITLTLLLAACAGTDDGPSSSGDDGTPEAGGSLTMALYLPTSSLDPVVNPGFGVAGGIELLAVYDSLMSWDPETGNYEPRMAESLESNDDFTEWTLTLREGVKFTDGTDYDAEAVKFSLDRHRVGGPTAPPCEETRVCPGNGVASAAYIQNIADVEVIDPLTLEITTDGPWPALPLVLAGEPGMVPSPTAILEACEPDTPVRDCDYGLAPVGAGPFKIDSFKPGEEVKLVRNDDYHRGDVLLDELKFISFGDTGGTKTAESLVAGGVDVAFLREPDAIQKARDAGLDGYTAPQQMGRLMWLNNGKTIECENGEPISCEGQPDGPYAPPTATSRYEVRAAINYAVDRDQVDQRVYDGLGLPGTSMFQDSFRLDPDVPGLTPDLEKAKEFVEKAKADGWDGKVRLFCSTAEADRGLAVASLLEAAGIDVELDTQFDSAGMLEVVNIRADYDMACTGLPLSNDDLGFINSLEGNLDSTSPRNRTGYSSDEMDEAVEQLHVAATDDEKRDALRRIAEIYNEDLPWLIEGAVEELIAWNSNVHGIVPTQSSEIFFDEVWLS